MALNDIDSALTEALKRIQTNLYVKEQETKGIDPHHKDDPRWNKTKPASIDDYTTYVKEAIELDERLSGTTNTINFTEEYPPTDLTTESITYMIKFRGPATMSGSKNPSSGIRNLKPLVRQTLDDPENPGYRLYVLSSSFDNIVTFNIWARTNKEANRRALWFENIMRKYLWYFRYNGVSNTWFEERNGDELIDIQGIKMFSRSLDYYVRTEELSTLSEKKIENIIIELTIGANS